MVWVGVLAFASLALAQSSPPVPQGVEVISHPRVVAREPASFAVEGVQCAFGPTMRAMAVELPPGPMTVQYSSGEPQPFHSVQLNAWLARIQDRIRAGEPVVDMFPCMEQWLFAFFRTAKSWCEANSADGEPRCREDDVGRGMARFRLQMSEVAQKLSDAHALPTVVPFESMNGTQSQFEIIAPYMREHCSVQFGPGLPIPEAFTREFLETKLSDVLQNRFSINLGDCASSIARSYVDALASMQMTQAQCERHAAVCERIRTGTRQTLAALSAWLERENAPRRIAEDIASCFSPTDEPDRFLNDVMVGLGEECVRLEPGQSRLVRTQATGLPATYRLSRPEANRYEVELNINFVPELVGSRDTGITTEDDMRRVREMREKVSSCFERAAPFMLAPEGTFRPEESRPSLRFRLASAGSDLPAANVTIVPREQRPIDVIWSESIDCLGILHEVAHHVGLVDEYRETQAGYRIDPDTGEVSTVPSGAQLVGSDCRIEGPDTSPMNNIWLAGAALATRQESLHCTCPVSTQQATPQVRTLACIDTSSPRWSPEALTAVASCPAGMNETRASLLRGNPLMPEWGDATEDLSARREQALSSLPEQAGLRRTTLDGVDIAVFATGFEIFRQTPPTRDSIFYPAHFTAITQPGCVDVNSRYYQCASLSRDTSRRRLGGGCSEVRRSECDGEDWLDVVERGAQ